MAFSPAYATNRLFYVYYTDRAGNTVVAEFRAGVIGPPARSLHSAATTTCIRGSATVVTPAILVTTRRTEFLPQEDPPSRHLNPNASWEIVGYGFRNPWRFSFDRATSQAEKQTREGMEIWTTKSLLNEEVRARAKSARVAVL